MSRKSLRELPTKTLCELGRGGMGVVTLAEVDGALVAVKEMLPELSSSEKARAMFLREARLLERLHHPNVVETLGIVGGEERPAIVMEFVDGPSLREILAARGGKGLPVAIAARIAHDVALGLHAAHELKAEDGSSLGVVHRDVSPHNVLVTFDGRVKLLDFGVAKANDDSRTKTGEVKGKIAYMAPEQALSDPIDRRSDIYALGALLYESLSGKRMHGEGTDLEILKRIATERPVPVRELVPELPAAIAALVDRMTRERMDERPATAEEVARELAPLAKEADTRALATFVRETLPDAKREHAARVDAARTSLEPTRIDVKRPRTWLAPVFAAAVAMAAVALLGRSGGARTDPSPSPSPRTSEEPVTTTITPAASSSAPPPASAPPLPVPTLAKKDDKPSVRTFAPVPPPTPSAKPPPSSPPPPVATPPPTPKLDPHPF